MKKEAMLTLCRKGDEIVSHRVLRIPPWHVVTTKIVNQRYNKVFWRCCSRYADSNHNSYDGVVHVSAK